MKRTTKIVEEEWDEDGTLVKRITTEETEEDTKVDAPPVMPNTPYINPLSPTWPNKPGQIYTVNPNATTYTSASSGNFKSVYPPDEGLTATSKPVEVGDKAEGKTVEEARDGLIGNSLYFTSPVEGKVADGVADEIRKRVRDDQTW